MIRNTFRLNITALLSLFVLLLSSICLQVSYATSINFAVYTKDSSGISKPVFEGGKVQDAWLYDASQASACHPAPTLVEQTSKSERIFQLENKYPFPVNLQLNVQAEDEKVLHGPSFQLGIPTNTGAVYSVQIQALKSGELKLIYNCNQDKNFFSENDVNPWSRVQITIGLYYGIDVQQKKITQFSFSLLKICPTTDNQSEKNGRFDWSLVILFIAAVAITAYGASISDRPLPLDNEEFNHAQELRTSHAILFILLGSICLLVLYFFLNYLEIVLFILVLISSFTASALQLSEYFQHFRQELTHKIYEVPHFCGGGQINLAQILGAIISLFIVVSYALTRNYLLSNLIAYFVVITVFRGMRLNSLKVATLLLILAFIYDIWWVFFSPLLFGRSVMAVVATQVDLPMKFQCPVFRALPLQTCSLIGLGDLVLPGLFISFCYRWDQQRETNDKNSQNKPQFMSYFKISVLGYAVGLFTCMLVLVAFSSAQPALLYLTPSTLVPVSILALMRGELRALWRGLSSFEDDSRLEQQDEKDSLELSSKQHRAVPTSEQDTSE